MTKGLTVDVGVVMSGSQKGDPEHFEISRELMATILSVNEARLVVDTENLIMNQYESKLGQKENSHGKKWIQQIVTSSKLDPVKRATINRGVQAALSDAGFSLANEDYRHYVRTVSASKDKRLISHDPDYGPKVCKILHKGLSVRVFDAQAGTVYLAGNKSHGETN